jgi:hypothetical protein
MKKVILTFCISLLPFSSVNAEEVKVKQKTYEELKAEFMKSAKKLEESKAKTEAVMKLGRTVDKLAKTLKVDE